MTSNYLRLDDFLIRLHDLGAKTPDYFVLKNGEEYNIHEVRIKRDVNSSNGRVVIRATMTWVRKGSKGTLNARDWSVAEVVKDPPFSSKKRSYGILVL